MPDLTLTRWRPRAPRRGVSRALVGGVGLALAVAGLPWYRHDAGPPAAGAPAVSPSSSPSTRQPASPQPPLVVRAAPGDLPVIDYEHAPRGFPPDPSPRSTAPVTQGLHPHDRVALYDAPGGRPLAFLPAAISGVEVTVPIVDRRAGWVAVLVPSIDRRIGWVPAGHRWRVRELTDQLVVRRAQHRLSWVRAGVPQRSWTVATGAPATPTPLGRTFVLGRTGTRGPAYTGLDALVLGSVPERREALPPSLRAGHTAIHGWYRASAFGRSVSNGCVRVPHRVQRFLLRRISSGTVVVILP